MGGRREQCRMQKPSLEGAHSLVEALYKDGPVRRPHGRQHVNQRMQRILC